MIFLRSYQDRACQQVMDLWRAGNRSVVLVMPTGAGKRIVAMWFMQLAAENNRRVLFVGNRRLLVTQALAEAQQHDLPYGVIMSDCLEGDPAATNQLASIQTLERWCFYERFSSIPTGAGLPQADLVIVDECHQDTRRFTQLLDFYPRAKALLLTATPVGAEGRSLVPQPYETLCEPVLNSQLIEQGNLLPTIVYAPSEPNIEGVKVEKGEYNQNQLGRRVQECTVFADVYSEWMRLGGDRATVAFVPGVAFGRDLVRQFNFLLGDGAATLIHAKTKNNEREAIFQRIEAGETKIIVSVDVLREGWDLPCVSCGVDLQPNSQLRSYWQKIGRVKRPYRNQGNAIWLDFAGNYWRFPHPNQDPLWPQGEETTQDVIKRSRKAATASQPIMCPKCSLVRERGPTCPGCGYTASEAIRRIRMGRGKLKEIPAYEKEVREKTEDERLEGKWRNKLFWALHVNASYAQAARLYQRETGEWPKEGWLGVFPKASVCWNSKVSDEFTKASLAKACYSKLRRVA